MITKRMMDEWHVEASEFVNSIKQEFMTSFMGGRQQPPMPQGMAQPQQQAPMPQQMAQPPQPPMPQGMAQPPMEQEQEEVDYGED